MAHLAESQGLHTEGKTARVGNTGVGVGISTAGVAMSMPMSMFMFLPVF